MISHNYARAVCYLLLSGLLLSGCARDNDHEIVRLNGVTMGTTYSIQVPGSDNVPGEAILSQEIQDILHSVDSTMSTWRDDSELSRLNNQPAGKWIPVSPDLLYVLDLALMVSHKTQGAFDITLDPLIGLWGFSSHERVTSLPDKKNIQNALQQVGYQYLLIDKPRKAIKKQIPVRLNLSAIAKGFAVDKIAEYLDEKGIGSYLIEVGGELRLKGYKPGGMRWTIAVETPSTGQRQPYRLITVTNHAIATSGDYRNYYEINGQRYSHTINPVTGYPVTHKLASVTVIAENTAYADALATAIMVMGPDKGYAFCERNNIPAYFIIKKDDTFISRHTRDMNEFLNVNSISKGTK